MDELSVRIERTERAALAELHAAAPAKTRAKLDLRLETIGEALVSIAPGEPSSLVNRTVGLGVERATTRETVHAVAAAYAECGVDRCYVHLQPDARPPEVADWLQEAGLAPVRGWMQFRRDAAPAPAAKRPSDLRVERIGPRHADAFARIVGGAFGLSAAAEPLLASLVDRPGWSLYLTLDGDEPAGAAALFVHDGIGWFDWAATRPEFRRRGSQGLLQRRRIRDALEAGCTTMITETGEAVSGDPQHSYGNILRAGFVEHRLRRNFAPRASG